MFQTALFDLDGTLLDTLSDLAAAGNHTLSALGFPEHPVQAYRKMVGSGIPNLVERMLPLHQRGPATKEIALSIFKEYYAIHMLDFTAPYPGIPELLAELQQRSVAMGVLSNKADNFVASLLDRYFPGIFSAFIGLRPELPPKPDPSSVFVLMERLHAFADTTLYIGDSDVDMHTAAAGGLASCGVLWGFRDRKELECAGACYLVDTPRALRAILLDEN